MENFLKFIQTAKNATRNLPSYNLIHLVLGNESCDLDSIISALSLAYLIHSTYLNKVEQYVVIPIMNVERKYFALRTEANYLLQKYEIHPSSLVFRGDIDYSDLVAKSEVKASLVDHHVLSSEDKILEQTVINIFDHRPINLNEICKSEVLEKTVIKVVGSCTTLVVEEIFNTREDILFDEICHLLYAAIIYDTIGLDLNSGRTFQEDLLMAEQLENRLKCGQNRKELFNVLWKVHNDTSNLSSKDLLYRDLKILKNILIPGVPMLVQEYLKRPDSGSAITEFAKENNSQSVVLIGINASEGVKRDIAVSSSDLEFKETFFKVLTSKGSDLMLEEIESGFENIVCFKQGNIKLTRKFILPLVDEAASLCTNKQDNK